MSLARYFWPDPEKPDGLPYLSSPQGREEAAAANNHGTAYDAQVIGFALYAGKHEKAREVMETLMLRNAEPETVFRQRGH